MEGFTAEGGRPRARLVVEADGAAAEFSIRLHKNNTVELHFSTIDREEAERRAALLRAVGVRAEVKKTYNRSLKRDVWQMAVTTNALAADSVHETVRRAVAEFLRQCREAGALGEDTYRRLAAKFERGVPEWGEVRFSVKLDRDGVVDVRFEPRDPPVLQQGGGVSAGAGHEGRMRRRLVPRPLHCQRAERGRERVCLHHSGRP